MTVELQRTFGESVGMDALVPTERHGDDPVECSDGTVLPHRDVCYDVKGGAHSSEDDAFDANVTIVSDFLDGVAKRAGEYATENTDYADGYAHIVDEMSHDWRDRVNEWVCNELESREGYDDPDDLTDRVADRVYEALEGSFDSEPEYTSSDYAAYSGSGCCLAQFDIGECEEQIEINAHDVLRDLHDAGVLDDILDHVNCDLYISRSRRRVRNEETGLYECVGRETYDAYGSDHPDLLGYHSPGGQWMFVVSEDRMRELVDSALLALTEITVSDDVLREHGYTEIVDQDEDGEVTLRNEDGGLEVFAIRDSYSGWCIPTDCGKVLESCRSVRE